MAKTKDEVAKKVLQRLTALATGQVPGDSDMQLARDAYDAVFKMLQAPELLAPWLVGDDIPEEAVFPIVGLCANLLTLEFSVAGEALQVIQLYANSKNPNGAYSQLRSNVYEPYSSDEDGPVEGEYF